MQLSLLAELDVPAELLKYEAFKKANPWVIRTLTRMSYELYNKGYKHYGIAALVEVLRYDYAINNDPNSEFKLNNNYRAFMAREIMQNEPMLEGFFSTRKSVADLTEDY
jgi:hypothetical protein